MQDVFTRFKSSRLWALVLFLALIVLNAMLNLGLTETDMTNAMWAVLGYMGFDTLRGTVVGGLLEQGARALTGVADAKLPDVKPDEESTKET